MTPRSYFGMALSVMVVTLFGFYIHEGGDLTAVAGIIFGGGLLFCGILIDPTDFMAVLNAVRGKPTLPPPPPGGPEGQFPTGGDK